MSEYLFNLYMYAILRECPHKNEITHHPHLSPHSLYEEARHVRFVSTKLRVLDLRSAPKRYPMTKTRSQSQKERRRFNRE